MLLVLGILLSILFLPLYCLSVYISGHYEMQTVQFEGPVEQAGRAVTSLQLPGATLRGAWYNIFSYLDQGQCWARTGLVGFLTVYIMPYMCVFFAFLFFSP